MNLVRKVACPLLVLALALTGCVSKENYNREVLRATNFQRLLSEEERRSAELTAEIVKLKEQVANLEGQSKTLNAQLKDAKAQIVKSLEEVGRLQDDLSEARATALALNTVRSSVPQAPAAKPKGKAGLAPAPAPAAPALTPSSEPPDRLDELQDGAGKKKTKAAAPPPAAPLSLEPPDRLGELQDGAAGKKKDKAPVAAKAPETVSASADDPKFLYYDVQKGETLAVIAKRYKTDAKTLRELNDLAANEDVKAGDHIIVGQKP